MDDIKVDTGKCVYRTQHAQKYPKRLLLSNTKGEHKMKQGWSVSGIVKARLKKLREAQNAMDAITFI